jgi:formylmethanofuran dehydrogenase subunit E
VQATQCGCMTGNSSLIWNDLSTTSTVLFSYSTQEAARVAIEEAVATIDHSDIRGSEPHNRDPSGAASD